MNRQMKFAWIRALGVVALVLAGAWHAGAQTTVTTADIQRLQDQVYEAGSEMTRMRTADATRLQTDLDDLRDEVVYLKVKMRKEGSVGRTEYADVRDRLQDLRARARGESPATRAGRPSGGGNTGYGSGTGGGVGGGVSNDGRAPGDDGRAPAGQTNRGAASAIPVGTEIDVRLADELSSENAQVEQRFEATTLVDLYRGNEVLIPAGSVVRGVVSSVDKATRMSRKGSLTVSFDQVTVRNRVYPLRGTVTQAIESEGIKGEAAKIGTGGAVGAIIGGILGGVKGALLGVLIGGGGTIAATEGKDVVLPPGTVLRVRLDTPPAIR